jgi:uncharacterized membrane protein
MLRRAAYRHCAERGSRPADRLYSTAVDSDAAPAEARSSGPLTAVLAGVVLVVGIVFISQATYANAWYSAFKTVHVIAAIVWIGGGAFLTILGVAAERKRDPIELANIARQAATVGEKVFAPAGLVVVAMGIAMMLNTDWGWGKFWIVAGLVGYAITFVTGVGVLSPMAKRVTALTEEKGPTHPETVAAITRILQIARIDVAMLLLVVVDMVTKPFS